MGRVLIRKSDGVPIEFQSADGPLETLMGNAISAGLNPVEYEVKYISTAEYKLLHYEKITKPIKNSQKDKKDKAKVKIMSKLRLSASDFQDLEDALK